MDTKTERGLNFKVISTIDDFVDYSPTIRSMVNEYLKQVSDKYTADDIMNIMMLAMDMKTMYVFVAERDMIGYGLMTAHAIDHGDAKRGAMLHIGYVPTYVTPEESKTIIKEAMDRLFDWARNLGMTSIFTQTQRSERPFDKLLMKHGWKRYTTVYEKEITNGKLETDSPDSRIPVNGNRGDIVRPV